MKKIITTSVASILLLLGTVGITHADLVQPLTVSLTAYDTDNRPMRINNRRLIEFLIETNVPNGRLFLVTPAGNAPGTTGTLNAFLRITSGTNIVAELRNSDNFVLLQDVAVYSVNGLRTSQRAINRIGIATGSLRAELQGFSNWAFFKKTVKGVDVSNGGMFTSTVNGWVVTYDFFDGSTHGPMPVTGTIVAGAPTPVP